MSKHKPWEWWNDPYYKKAKEKNRELFNGTYYDDTTYYQDTYYQGYDHGFNAPIRDTSSKASWDKEWKTYKTTGQWHGYGYYVRPTLDYQYIEQVANALASQYNITVELSSSWAIDIDSKTLHYNPYQMMDRTKGVLIATLLHEIGHLRYSTPYTSLISTYLKRYPVDAQEVINVFEDFRVDDRMIKSYPTSEEVYQAMKPIIKEMAEKYREMKSARVSSVEKILQFDSIKIIPGYEKLTPEQQAETKSKVLDALRNENDTLEDYLANILLVGYGEPMYANANPTMQERIEKTKGAIQPVLRSRTMQDYMSILDTAVFPIIKDLLDANRKGSKELIKLLGEKGAKELTRRIGYQQSVRSPKDKNHTVRGVGAGKGNGIPPQWTKGDYTVLKNSVQKDIQALVKKLTFLQREEQIPRYQSKMLRGKLDLKRLYHHRIPDARLFKKKLPNTDTVRSFAFSLIVDISGSMNGERIVHATRGLIILAEVFDHMRIPFEYIAYSDSNTQVKRFQDAYTKTIKGMVGGMVKNTGGGTNLVSALKGTNIATQPEHNKIVIIISDGGLFDWSETNKILAEWDKKNGIRTLGFGIQCDDQIKHLYAGRGYAIKEPGALPQKFSEVLKKLITKKRP